MAEKKETVGSVKKTVKAKDATAEVKTEKKVVVKKAPVAKVEEKEEKKTATVKAEKKTTTTTAKITKAETSSSDVEGKKPENYYKEKSQEIEESIKAKLEANPTISKDFKQLVSVSKLMETGAHIGLTAKKWNPKMKKYVYAKKGKNHIIDIYNTMVGLSDAFNFLKDLSSKGKVALFLGTKTFVVKKQIRDQAKRVNAFYVNQRWLGGTLTNFKTIQNSTRKLNELVALQKSDAIEKYSKKEQVEKLKEIKKLNKFFGGIRTMNQLPDVLIVNDPVEEKNAIAEAKKLGIKIIAICNTNANPEGIDIVIPANNYSIKTVYLIIGILADAIAAGQGKPMMYAGKKDEEIILPQTFYQNSQRD